MAAALSCQAKKLCIILLNSSPCHAVEGLVASDTRMSCLKKGKKSETLGIITLSTGKFNNGWVWSNITQSVLNILHIPLISPISLRTSLTLKLL